MDKAKIISRIDHLEKEKNLFLPQADEKPENTEKRLESRRRWRLEQLGCNPDNHPKNHTAEVHIDIVNRAGEIHRETLLEFIP